MKRTLFVVAVMAALPALALGAPMLKLTWGGIGTTPDTSNITTDSIDYDTITAGTLGGTPAGWSFWLNVVLDQQEMAGQIGAFGAGLDVNAAGVGKLYIRGVEVAKYDISGDDDWTAGWDPNGAPVGTLVGQRFGAELANIGLTSAVKVGSDVVNPPAAVFPVVESIRIRMYAPAPDDAIVISFADPGGGLNWGCMTASAPSGGPVPSGDFAPSQLGSFTILPEPTTLGLLVIGGTLLALRRRTH